jgi:hypothetical protein
VLHLSRDQLSQFHGVIFEDQLFVVVQVEFEADAAAQVAKDRELVSGSTKAFELRQAVRKQLVGVPLLGKAHNLLVDLSGLDGERIRDLLAVEAVGDLGIEEELSRLKSKVDVILLKEQLLDIDVLGIFFGLLGVAGIGRLLLSLLPILMIPIRLLCLQLLLSFLLFLA